MATPKHTGGIDLEGAAELWQTPKAMDTGNPRALETRLKNDRQTRDANCIGNYKLDLMDQVGLWQTPAVDSFRRCGGDRKDEMGLDQQARFTAWGTPTSRDYKDQGGGSNNEYPNEGTTGSPNDALFPPGPADRDAWRTIIATRPDLAPAVESPVRRVAARIAGGLDFARADQLRSLGNMVVPQQGALAFLVLIDRAVAFQPGQDERTGVTK